MNEDRLKYTIRRFEGYSEKVYADSMGYPTCGYGHMDKNMIIGQSVSPSVCEMFYRSDSLAAINIAREAVGVDCFNDLDEGRMINLIQLAYNLSHRLYGFKHTIAAIQNGDWQEAANQIMNSDWAGQVGHRANETADCFLFGKYSWED